MSFRRHREIFCAACGLLVRVRLVTGKEIYPHRPDLHHLPFWRCLECGNYVGCHHRDRIDSTRPLGDIPTPELRDARKHLHRLIDPLWKEGAISRKRLYARISTEMDQDFHCSTLRFIEDARHAYRIVLDIKEQLAKEERTNGTTTTPRRCRQS